VTQVRKGQAGRLLVEPWLGANASHLAACSLALALMLFWLFGSLQLAQTALIFKKPESRLLSFFYRTPLLFPFLPLPSTSFPQTYSSYHSKLLCSNSASHPVPNIHTHVHMNSPRAMAARAARSRRRSSSSFQWSTLFYILLVLCAPMLLATAVKADDQEPLKDAAVSGPVIGIDLGTTYSCVGVSPTFFPQTNHDHG
jgi:hypothetical protein